MWLSKQCYRQSAAWPWMPLIDPWRVHSQRERKMKAWVLWAVPPYSPLSQDRYANLHKSPHRWDQALNQYAKLRSSDSKRIRVLHPGWNQFDLAHFTGRHSVQHLLSSVRDIYLLPLSTRRRDSKACVAHAGCDESEEPAQHSARPHSSFRSRAGLFRPPARPVQRATAGLLPPNGRARSRRSRRFGGSWRSRSSMGSARCGVRQGSSRNAVRHAWLEARFKPTSN